jgi:hypothetical protein
MSQKLSYERKKEAILEIHGQKAQGQNYSTPPAGRKCSPFKRTNRGSGPQEIGDQRTISQLPSGCRQAVP